MIKLYESNERLFNHNGLKILKPTKAIITKKDNDEYFLELEDNISNLEYYQQGRIIRVPTPWGEQGFRLNNPEKKNNKISIKAWHLFYDSRNYIIKDAFVVDKNCNDALDHLNTACDVKTPFKTLSNITNINSYRCVRKSLEEAVQVILERWEGHIERDNFTIKVLDKIGEDRNVTLSYGKNIKDIQAEENWNDVVTKLMPVGKDGLLLDEVWLESDIQYDIPYTKVITFNQDNINAEDFETEEDYQQTLIEDLKIQAIEYLEKNKVPKVNYKLSAYLKDIADVGDVIYVKHDKCAIDIITNVISVKYDVILQNYKEIEFGNFKKTLSNLLTQTQNQATEIAKEQVETSKVFLKNELDEATSKIWGVLGNSYIINEGDKILAVDRLPKETAKYVLMINSAGIGFSSSGINGPFNSAWTIDGTLDMQQINVINLVADLIKGGTLKLGSELNEFGKLEVYDESNKLIAELNKSGLKMYGQDDSYVLLNNEVGFAGFDRNNNKIYWVDKDEFHMKKSVVEEEITLCNKMRFIPITITDTNGSVVNDGIGLVSVY